MPTGDCMIKVWHTQVHKNTSSSKAGMEVTSNAKASVCVLALVSVCSSSFNNALVRSKLVHTTTGNQCRLIQAERDALSQGQHTCMRAPLVLYCIIACVQTAPVFAAVILQTSNCCFQFCQTPLQSKAAAVADSELPKKSRVCVGLHIIRSLLRCLIHSSDCAKL